MMNATEKTLLKLRKRATSALSTSAVSDALMTLGYTVRKGSAWYELTRREIRPGKGRTIWEKNGLGEVGRELRLRLNTYAKGDELACLAFSYEGDGEDTDPGLEKIRAAREEVASLSVDFLPERAELDRIVTTHVGDISTETWNLYGGLQLEHSFDWTAWIGRPCLTVTDPEGENSTTFFTRDQSSHELTKWLFKETKLAERAAAELGMPTTEEEDREREYKARDWTNTGTCPCCSRNIKIRDGRMVLHGYERPGIGHTIGSCFGCGYEPYERSAQGTCDYRGHVEGIKAGLTELLSKLQEPNYSEPLATKYGHGRNKTIVMVTKNDAHEWKRLLESKIYATERDIRHVDHDIESLTKKIEAWEPGMKMPEEIAREKGWIK